MAAGEGVGLPKASRAVGAANGEIQFQSLFLVIG